MASLSCVKPEAICICPATVIATFRIEARRQTAKVKPSGAVGT